jgi:hypothetical protein
MIRECLFSTHNNYVTKTARLLIPSNKTFQDCVHLLNEVHGDVLRRLSLAVEGIVLSIFHGTLSKGSALSIEKVERAQILSLPKGSAILFDLLADTI